MKNLTSKQKSEIIRRKLDEASIIQHCFNCDYQHHNADGIMLCDRNRDAGQPPAKVLVYGCANWQMEIPF